jgi:hypothetical protein
MRGVISFVFVLSAFASMLMYDHFGLNRAGSKLKEIETLWSAIPPYGRSIEISSDSTSSGRKAYVSKKYKSDAGYDDISGFYHEILLRNGWYLVDEGRLTDWGIDNGGIRIKYRQGDYTLSIEYAGKKADYGWNYGIGIGWSNYWLD